MIWRNRILVCVLLIGIANCFSLHNRNNLLTNNRLNNNNNNNQINNNNNNQNNNNKDQYNLNLKGEGWHIHVTMHVYSGRADPMWYIPDTHPSYKVILRNMKTIPAKPLPSKLGYKGFSLAHVPPGETVAKGGHYNQTVTSFPDWEMYLLQTSASMGDEMRTHAKQSILNSKTTRIRRSNSLYYPDYDYSSLFGNTDIDPIDELTDDDMYKLAKLWGLDKRFRNISTTPIPPGPTKYEPEKWNKYFVKDHNNCYNYANNKITDTFAQPGRAGNCEMSLYMRHGTEIEKLAKCDGLKTVYAPDLYTLPPHNWNLVALVFWPPEPGSTTFDFHWYRLDDNGRWSHKPGHTTVTNVDQNNKPILDPRHCERGPYTEFVAFLQTQQDKVILF